MDDYQNMSLTLKESLLLYMNMEREECNVLSIIDFGVEPDSFNKIQYILRR